MANLLPVLGNRQTPPSRIGTDGTGVAGVAASITFAHTVPAGCNRLVVLIEAGKNFDNTITSVTWNGAALTELVDAFSSVGGERANVGIYYLDNPTAGGPFNIVVTFGANMDASRARAVNVYNADTSVAPVSALSTSALTRVTATVNMTVTKPTLFLVCAAWSRVSTSYTPDANLTELADAVQGGGGNLTYFEGVRTVQEGGTYGFTVTVGTTRAGALAVIAIAGR